MRSMILLLAFVGATSVASAQAAEFKLSSLKSSEIKAPSFSQSASPHTMTVKPLTQTQKPSSFEGHVAFKSQSISPTQNTKFSIESRGAATPTCAQQQTNTNLTMMTSELKGRLSTATDLVRRATSHS